jgi:hypothetical protein
VVTPIVVFIFAATVSSQEWDLEANLPTLGMPAWEWHYGPTPEDSVVFRAFLPLDSFRCGSNQRLSRSGKNSSELQCSQE